MPLSDEDLELVVLDWNSSVTRLLRTIDVVAVLRRKNLSMYMALGLTHPQGFADRVVNDYIASSIENTMGQLYELLLAQLGPTRVSKQQRTLKGYRGIDFLQDTEGEIRLIDLAAASNTKNGGARTKSRRDMRDAAAYWENADTHVPQKSIVQIWAVARGTPSKSQTDEIIRLRGDAMWEYFGAGENFLTRVGESLARNPVTVGDFHLAVDSAALELIDFLKSRGFLRAGGSLDWNALLAAFP